MMNAFEVIETSGVGDPDEISVTTIGSLVGLVACISWLKHF